MLDKPFKITTGLSSPNCRWVIVMSFTIWSFYVLHPECRAKKLIALKDHLDTMLVAMLLCRNFRIFIKAEYVHNPFRVSSTTSSSRFFLLFFKRDSISYW